MWTRPLSIRPIERRGSLLILAVLGLGFVLSASSAFAQMPTPAGPELPGHRICSPSIAGR